MSDQSVVTESSETNLIGEVWVAGQHWHVTSFGLEASGGTCRLPASILGHYTLTNAATVMSPAVLAEFVTCFNFAMLLHGHCRTVDPAIMLDWLRKHFHAPTPPAPVEVVH